MSKGKIVYIIQCLIDKLFIQYLMESELTNIYLHKLNAPFNG